MINLPLMKCTLHVLDFLWFDVVDVKRIQNVTSFLRTFTCVIILRFGDFALSYAFVCCSNIVMFPKNEKTAVRSILETSYDYCCCCNLWPRGHWESSWWILRIMYLATISLQFEEILTINICIIKTNVKITMCWNAFFCPSIWGYNKERHKYSLAFELYSCTHMEIIW